MKKASHSRGTAAALTLKEDHAAARTRVTSPSARADLEHQGTTAQPVRVTRAQPSRIPRNEHARRTARTHDSSGTAAEREQVFRGLPAAASEWTCRRIEGGARVTLTYPAAGGVEVRAWPVSELAVDTIRERWGGGTFEIGYVGSRGGKRVPLGRTQIKLREPSVARQPEPPPVAALAVPDPISAVVALMRIAQSQADTVVGQVRVDTDRTIEREREFAQRELDRQQRLFEQIERVRASVTPPADNDRLVRSVNILAKRLKRRQASEVDDLASQRDSAAPNSRVLEALAEQLGPTIGQLLVALTPAIGELVGAMAARLTTPVKSVG